MHILWVLEEGGSSTRHKGIVYTGKGSTHIEHGGYGIHSKGGWGGVCDTGVYVGWGMRYAECGFHG